MKREFKVEANVGKPSRLQGDHSSGRSTRSSHGTRSRTGGSGQFAKVLISIEPFSGEDGATYEFENKVTRRPHPARVHPSVDPGAQDAMQYGVLGRLPLVNLKVTLLDGSYHEVTLGNGNSRSPAPGAEKGCAASATSHPGTDHWPSRSLRPRTTWAT